MKKKKQEPSEQREGFRLSRDEYFWMVRHYYNPCFSLLLSPVISEQYEQAWNEPETYPFRKTDREELPSIGMLLELMPL